MFETDLYTDIHADICDGYDEHPQEIDSKEYECWILPSCSIGVADVQWKAQTSRPVEVLISVTVQPR